MPESQDPYEAPEGDEEPESPSPVLFQKSVSLKIRCLFALPSLLYLLILFSLPLLHQLGAPVPAKPGKILAVVIFGVLAIVTSLATTQLLARPGSLGRPTVLLTFLSHLFIQVVLLFAAIAIVLIASQIL